MLETIEEGLGIIVQLVVNPFVVSGLVNADILLRPYLIVGGQVGGKTDIALFVVRIDENLFLADGQGGIVQQSLVCILEQWQDK